MTTFRLATCALWTALVLGTGGCANIDYGSFRLPDFSDKLRLPSMAAPVEVESSKSVTAEDLVDAQGNCASAPMASAAPPASSEQQAPADPASGDPVTMPINPALAGGIALGMSECDVVKRAGPPEKVALGQNERAERTLVLSYLHNTRPGIYSFVAGRLTSIDRVDEPPPPKPSKPARTAKPKPKPKPPAT